MTADECSERMSARELHEWGEYLTWKADEERKAYEAAKAGAKRGR